MTTCPTCKLPGEAHASPEQCVVALRAELDRSEVWKDNQRLQRELSAKPARQSCRCACPNGFQVCALCGGQIS